MTTDTAAGESLAGATAEAQEARVRIGDAELPLVTVLESLLFVADKPVAVEHFAQVLKLPSEEVAAGLHALAAAYASEARGLRLQWQQGKVRLVTAPVAAQAIEEFLNLDLNTRLSGPALETLAVVAYRAPVTRAQVEAVRGVDCGGVLRSLVQRGLVEEVGRLDSVGRPILYGVTEHFMHHFGLVNMDELPPLRPVEQAVPEQP